MKTFLTVSTAAILLGTTAFALPTAPDLDEETIEEAEGLQIAGLGDDIRMILASLGGDDRDDDDDDDEDDDDYDDEDYDDDGDDDDDDGDDD